MNVFFAWSLGLLISGAPIAVHAEAARDLRGPEVVKVLRELGRAIERRTGAKPNVRPFEGTDHCSRKVACRRFIYEATGATQVVYVRLIGVPTRIRVIAELVGPPRSTVMKRAQVDIRRGKKGLPAPKMDELAATLFPEGRTALQAKRDGPSIGAG